MKHGGDLTEAITRYGGDAADWLDLSTGINPWPYPFGDIADAAWRRLPSQGDEQALLDAARRAYGVPDGAGIVAAPGTQALIQWLPHLAANGPVAIVGPTYNEHAPAWQSAGH
ncbi:MAG: threonine-phosphate decarboxylase, partial [Tardiphaga sp.]